MKKIYPKEWLELHPYQIVDEVDRYYTDVANQIYQVLNTPLADGMFEEEDARYFSLCLAAWFEDVISQVGIWTTFTAACKKRYGNWLPFYPLDENYYPDEINVEDIRFLLWHHIQFSSRDEGRIINPENPGIELIANELYCILDEIYETAPENERLWLFMHPEGKGGWDSFEKYRLVLQWFHYGSYFNIENQEQYEDELEEITSDLSEDWQGKKNLLVYNTYTALMLQGRRDLLSLTSCEWLALWAEQNNGPQEWRSTKEYIESFFLLTGEDDGFLYLQDLCGKDEVYRVAKDSFDLSSIKERQVGESVALCTLLHYGKVWNQIGMMSLLPSLNNDIKQAVESLRDKKEHRNEKAVYEDFIRATGGKPFYFCKSRQEMIDFLTHEMKYRTAEGLKLPSIRAKHGLILMASPRTGLYIQTQLCECVKSPDNPFYDAKAAAQKAHSFLLSPDVIPYDLSCMLQDKGMLPDAMLNSLKGEEYGRKFLQQNAHFLTDYFFHRCREKDYDECSFMLR
ncbi:DUF3843 family protein [Phocaeicola salanitronis]|uniref:DUF3843 family protein n=1 Tax=Phocaeicola salanitronis TaxID=376805 RepID=UPI0023F7BEFE|nr:DUF3843 family protein [Phocaeicola salanitronis]